MFEIQVWLVNIAPVCRLCRREGMKLFLKGTRCDTPKCAFERRESPPGMTTSRRGKPTDYGLHLREKQKVKHYYGVLERQFRKYFQQAERTKGNTGDALMSLLERRLDNIVARLGLGPVAGPGPLDGQPTATSRSTAGWSNIPSYLVRPGDVIRVKNRTKSQTLVQANRGRPRPRGARFPQPRRKVRSSRGMSSACRSRPTCRSRCRPN